MIEIKITDLSVVDKETLGKLGKFFMDLGGHVLVDENVMKAMKQASSPQPAPADPRVLPASVPVPLPHTLTPVLTNETVNPFAPEVNPVQPPIMNPVPTGTVDLDSNGLPWDARIHSKNRSKIADGSWKLKREVAPQLVSQVQAELRQAMSIPPLVDTSAIPPMQAPEPIKPKPEPIDAKDDFPSFMKRATDAINTRKITHEELMTMVRSFGLSSVALVATRPDLLPKISAKLNTMI